MSTDENKRPRIKSVDFLRGIVMILMALDHTREFFHYDSFLFSPTDLSKTSIPIFLTRFVTHFCAPVFVFLAGTSAFFMSRKRSKKSLSVFLIKRGFWLILLEFTIVKFAWLFRFDIYLNFMLVIWVLGASMIILAFVIHLPKKIAILIASLIILGHNILDFIHFDNIGFLTPIWQILYSGGKVSFPLENFQFYAFWPLLPWIGLIILGFFFGQIYDPSFGEKKRINFLYSSGIILIVLFIILRAINVYGDPNSWKIQNEFSFTILSFINVSKYPPSLLFLLITMGPSLIILGTTEKIKGKIANRIIVFGRVPLFYYVIHLYVIHLLALIAAILTGYQFSDMVFDFAIHLQEELKGYGFKLGIVYLIWLGILLSLYPLCFWFNNYKNKNTDKWWVSYL